jgi:regulator of sigma E protease
MSIILAILILGLMILFHEFGHFIFCKIFGVRVLRFSIGFGPAIFKRKIGDTEFRLSLIPLGGYVTPLEKEKLEVIIEERVQEITRTMNISESLAKQIAWEEIRKEFGISQNSEKLFLESKPYYQKFLIVLAGPLFNIILAIFFMYFLLVAGYENLGNKLGKILENSPAEKSGLQPGDIVLEVNKNAVKTWQDIRREIALSEGKVKLKVQRGEQILYFEIEPKISDGRRIIGILPDENNKILIRYSPISAVPKSVENTVRTILDMFYAIKLIFTKEGIESIGGPITIAKVTSDAAKESLQSLLSVSFLISLNLAILNLLPIPVLDGGHILIFTIEALMGRRLNYKTKFAITVFGLFLILILAFIGISNDIKNIFKKG